MEEEKSPEDTLAHLLEQIMEASKTIQKCADHQKCMTDDVLQLSRLRAHKLTIANSLYSPYETVRTAMTAFKPQAESKVFFILSFFPFLFIKKIYSLPIYILQTFNRVWWYSN